MSSLRAYLEPVRGRPNLQVTTRARVTAVVMEGGRAVGVRYRGVRGERLVRARREVVLSAGAYGSPHLLMLSGVGPRKHLESLNISVVQVRTASPKCPLPSVPPPSNQRDEAMYSIVQCHTEKSNPDSAASKQGSKGC